MHGVGMYFARSCSDGLGWKWVNFLWSLCAESLFLFNILFRFFLFVFFLFVLVVSFSQNSILLVWDSLPTFLCFVRMC